MTMNNRQIFLLASLITVMTISVFAVAQTSDNKASRPAQTTALGSEAAATSRQLAEMTRIAADAQRTVAPLCTDMIPPPPGNSVRGQQHLVHWIGTGHCVRRINELYIANGWNVKLLVAGNGQVEWSALLEKR